jgi:hypothetical protein
MTSANDRLRASLKTARTGGAQVAAFAAYSSALARVLAQLRTLRPPPVMRPVQRSEEGSVAAMVSLTAQVESAIRRRQVKRLDPLFTRFQKAAQSTGSVAAQRAEIAAIRAYDRRLRAISDLAFRIRNERERLQNELG